MPDNAGYSNYPPTSTGAGPSSYPIHQGRRDTMNSSSESIGQGNARGMSFSTTGNAPTPDQDVKAAAGKKRRKKSTGETDKEKEKRTKTGRACDACVSPIHFLH
jgi:hypothetical protein